MVESRFGNIVAQVEPARAEVPGVELALRLVNKTYAVLSDPVRWTDGESEGERQRSLRSWTARMRWSLCLLLTRSSVTSTAGPGRRLISTGSAESVNSIEIRNHTLRGS